VQAGWRAADEVVAALKVDHGPQAETNVTAIQETAAAARVSDTVEPTASQTDNANESAPLPSATVHVVSVSENTAVVAEQAPDNSDATA
jgi:hypothetical protein